MCYTVKDVEWLPISTVTIPSIESDTESDEDQMLTASELDDDQYSIISISSGSVTSMSSIYFSEVKPFVSSDDMLVGSDGINSKIESNIDTDTDEGAQDVNTSSEPESDLDELPDNALDIIQNFQHYQTLPEVIHNLIIFPQQSAKFQFLYQLDPLMCTWDHTCLCWHPSEGDNSIKF